MKRRKLIKVAASLAVLPALPLIARASTPVDMNNPGVIALKYVEDASDAARTDKMGYKAEDQICENCRFYSVTDEIWGGCTLFQNRLVKAKGWCTGWVPVPQ